MFFLWRRNVHQVRHTLTILIPLAISFAIPLAINAEQLQRPSGHWDIARKNMPEALTPEQRDDFERLSALGYLDATEEAQSEQTITIYDKSKSFNGVNLYVSGHRAEAILVDMHGAVLQQWAYDPTKHSAGLLDTSHEPRWHMAHPYPNGDIIVLQHHEGLLKLDKNSSLIWARAPGFVHHDMDVTENGAIFVLTRSPEMMRWISEEKPIVNDTITEINPDGTVVRKVSILECLRNAGEDKLLAELSGNVERHNGDILHTNSIEVLDGAIVEKAPEFSKGRILLSIRRIDCLMVVDLDKEEVVWWRKGEYKNQHDASILDNGNLIVFDNNQYGTKSAIREIDVATGQEKWVYKGTIQNPFFAFQSGRCQRLPNGNTLIVESTFGRVFEVTQQKDIVWEFWNPKRAGKNNDLIARIYECIRLPRSYFEEWLPE